MCWAGRTCCPTSVPSALLASAVLGGLWQIGPRMSSTSGERALSQRSGKSESPSGCYQKSNLGLRPWFYLPPKKHSSHWPHALFRLTKHRLGISTKGRETPQQRKQNILSFSLGQLPPPEKWGHAAAIPFSNTGLCALPR